MAALSRTGPAEIAACAFGVGMTLIAFLALLAWTLTTAWIVWSAEEGVAAAAVPA